MINLLSLASYKLIFDDGRSTYRGLLPSSVSPALPPDTMTRQRRRAAARAAAKH